MPVDHLPAPQREDLDGGARALGGDPDHVDRARLAPVRALPLGEVLDREEPVPVAGRVLEALVRGRLAHPALESPHDRLRVAREELDHLVDQLAVELLRDVADAGRVAALDVVVEARDSGVSPRLRPFAGAELEDAVEHVERLPHLLRVGVGPEVDDAAPVSLAREHDARELVLDGDGDVRERLVVAEADVVRRPVPLDEVLLEVERLDLGAGDDHLEVVDSGDESRDRLAGVAASGLEVRAHAWAQRLRLADVEHAALGVAKEVDARLRGQAFQLVADVGHSAIKSRCPRGAYSSITGRRYRVADETGVSRTSGGVRAGAGRARRGTDADARRRRGRRPQREPRRGKGADDAAPARRLPDRAGDLDLEAGRAGAERVRAQDPGERGGGGRARQRPCLRLGPPRGLADDAAHARGPDAVRRVRGRSRAHVSELPRRDRRQRAEPEPFLAAAVRRRRLRSVRARLPDVARRDLRRAEGRVAGRARDRRCAGAARCRPAGHRPRHDLADEVHPRARRRVSREWENGAGDGRLRLPSLRRQLEPLARSATFRSGSPRARRLSKARRAARGGVRRHRAGRVVAPDPLRRVRCRGGDPGRRRRRSTRAPSLRRRGPSPRRSRRRTTGGRSSSRSASRT